ncbi:methyl-accepting chemotaxis protein [Thalassotalea montiporae]
MSKEQRFSEQDILLSTTDLNSHIKYANDSFCNIAGYELDEMIGQPHNMVRHPDMPKAAFKNLWSYIKDGKPWMGLVKNRCKNGDYYWVNAYVTPIKNEKGEVYEYQSVRTAPDRDAVARAEKLYQQLNEGKSPVQLTAQLDATLVFQIIAALMSVLSITSLVLEPTSVLAWIMSILATSGCFLFGLWRKRYKTVVNRAKQTFDNPLMNLVYSGINSDLSCVDLALRMQKAELRAVVGRVADDSGKIAESAVESAERGSGIAQILSSQKSETEQVATAIHQMSCTVQEIAEVVANGANVAQQGLVINDQGQQVVTNMVAAISELSAQLGNVDSAISRLITGSRTIETVLSEISSIADQTNLLALNAAIEAARAGEQGRGFAVVAEEVRALAMRSQQSTDEIAKLLAQLREESDAATNAMVKGNDLSANCVDLANDTGTALAQLNSEVTELANISAQIATAVEEQSVVAEQINQNVSTISQMSSESEQHGREAVSLSEILLDRLNDQKSLVAQFNG